jgi:hypothetical protein
MNETSYSRPRTSRAGAKSRRRSCGSRERAASEAQVSDSEVQVQKREGPRWAGLVLGNFGGAEGNRTPDLLHAMQALSQLSYSPEGGGRFATRSRRRRQLFAARRTEKSVTVPGVVVSGCRPRGSLAGRSPGPLSRSASAGLRGSTRAGPHEGGREARQGRVAGGSRAFGPGRRRSRGLWRCLLRSRGSRRLGCLGRRRVLLPDGEEQDRREREANPDERKPTRRMRLVRRDRVGRLAFVHLVGVRRMALVGA